MLVARIEKVCENARCKSNLVDVRLVCAGKESPSMSVRLDTGADISSFSASALKAISATRGEKALVRAYDGRNEKQRTWKCSVKILELEGLFALPFGCIGFRDSDATPSLGMDVLSQLNVHFDKGQATLAL